VHAWPHPNVSGIADRLEQIQRAAAFASDEFGAVYAVASDDQRFLMIRANAVNGSDQLIVVDNWFEELRSRARK
jgi:hypothetical protein